jgi:hypothetical protein
VEEDGRLLGGGSGSVGAVLEDGSDRFVRAGVEQQRLGAGGVDAFLAIALDQAENADGVAEALFRMWPRPQDDVDQRLGIGADLGGFGTNALMTPDADLSREMIGFAAQRLMELEVESQTGAAYGEKSPERPPKWPLKSPSRTIMRRMMSMRAIEYWGPTAARIVKPQPPHFRGLVGQVSDALLLFDRNAMLPNTDFDAGGFLPFLVELITQYRSDDGERGDDEIENVAVHYLRVPFPRHAAAVDQA